MAGLIPAYLTGRTQSVYLDGMSTTPRKILCGVSLGSVVWLLLFKLYTADIGCIIRSHNLLHHCYADDTQLYFSCTPQESACLKSRVIACVEDIAGWMASNRSKINPAKSEFLWCATARHLHHIDNSAFRLADSDVVPTTYVRNSDAYCDASMSMATHASRLVSTCFYRPRRGQDHQTIDSNVNSSPANK